MSMNLIQQSKKGQIQEMLPLNICGGMLEVISVVSTEKNQMVSGKRLSLLFIQYYV